MAGLAPPKLRRLGNWPAANFHCRSLAWAFFEQSHVMSDHPFPAELRDFLATHIDSIVQLEALLLLRHSQDVVWDVQGAAKRLYVGEREALAALTHLAALGLITQDGNSYRFDPQSDELTGMVALLAECYRAYLIPITNLIHAKPRRIQQFADAFKLKKD